MDGSLLMTKLLIAMWLKEVMRWWLPSSVDEPGGERVGSLLKDSIIMVTFSGW